MYSVGQVQTVEDDFKTDFYKDLISFGKKKDKKASASAEKRDSIFVPIFFSSRKSERTQHNFAIKEAIQASHKKVRKTLLHHAFFLRINVYQSNKKLNISIHVAFLRDA